MDKSRLELQGNEFSENSKSNSAQTIRELLTIAESYLKQGEFDQALTRLNLCASLEPDSGQIYLTRAEVYLQTGNYHQALADLSRLIEWKPDSETAYIQRGEIYRLLKQPQEALSDLSQAVKLDPGNSLALGRRGTLYRNLKEFTRSLADYDRALELNPTSSWLYGNRAETYRSIKDYAKAVNDYNQVLKLNPSATWVYERRSYPNLWLEDLDTARSDFEMAWKANPANIMDGWMAEWTGMCRKGFSFSPQVKERLKSLANSDPNHYAAYLCRASLYCGLQVSFRESYNQAKMACTLISDKPEAYFWKGMAASGLKQNRQALSLIQKALELGLPPVLLAPVSWFKQSNPALYNELGPVSAAETVTDKSQSGTAKSTEQAETVKIPKIKKIEPKTPPVQAARQETLQAVNSREIEFTPLSIIPDAPTSETLEKKTQLNIPPDTTLPRISQPATQPVSPTHQEKVPAANGMESARQELTPTTGQELSNKEKAFKEMPTERLRPVKPAALPSVEKPAPVVEKPAPVKELGEAVKLAGTDNKQNDINRLTHFRAEENKGPAFLSKKGSILRPVLLVGGFLIACFLFYALVLNRASDPQPTNNNPAAIVITAKAPVSTAIVKVPTSPATGLPQTVPNGATPSPSTKSLISPTSIPVALTATQPDLTAVLAIYATPAAGDSTATIAPNSTPTAQTVTLTSNITAAATTARPTGQVSLEPVLLSPLRAQALTGHTGAVTTASWSRDGRYFATGSEDKTIKIREVATNKVVITLAPKNNAQAGSPVAINWSNDNAYIVSGWTDNHVRLFSVFPTDFKNADTVGQIQTEATDNVLPEAVAISDDNILVTYPGKDILHSQNNSNNSKGPDFLLGKASRILAVKFSPDNRFLAAGLSDGRVLIWDRATLKLILAILPDQNSEPNTINVLDWTSDGKYLAIGSQKTLTVYGVSLTGGAKILNIPVSTEVKASVTALRFSTDNKLLAVGYQNGSLQLWSIAQTKLLGQVMAGSEAVLSLNFSSSDQQVSALTAGKQPALLTYTR